MQFTRFIIPELETSFQIHDDSDLQFPQNALPLVNSRSIPVGKILSFLVAAVKNKRKRQIVGVVYR